MTKTYIKSRTYEIYPNKQMKKILDANCDYRRYCWNQALQLWNDMYDAHSIFDQIYKVIFNPRYSKATKKWHIVTKEFHKNPSPTWRSVRDIMFENKEDWQYTYSSRLMDLAVKDLGNAWKNFFDKSQTDWGKPKFKSKNDPKQGFKTDIAKFTKDGRLRLDKPQGYKGDWSLLKLSRKPLPYPTGAMSFYRENGKYYVAVPYKIPATDIKKFAKTGKTTGVDVNVGHFNYADGVKMVLPGRSKKTTPEELKNLTRTYNKIKHYQRVLARKRVVNGNKQGTQSKKYLATRAKLQRAYQKCNNIQHDLMHKYTTMLVKNYDSIVIEDLSVKDMMMSHVASKGMHRSMFGLFRQLLTYKCDYYDKKLIVANKLYPSTQRCAVCGMIKKGDERVTLRGNQKHHTRHNEFVCYNPSCPNYLKVVDRDKNAMLNLTYLAQHPEMNKAL